MLIDHDYAMTVKIKIAIKGLLIYFVSKSDIG